MSPKSLPTEGLPVQHGSGASRRLAFIAGAVGATAALVVMLATLLVLQNQQRGYADQTARKAARAAAKTVAGFSRTASISGCDSANDVRAFARVAVQREPRLRRVADARFALRDCAATYDQQRPVIVADTVADEYVKRWLAGGNPIVRDGKVQ